MIQPSLFEIGEFVSAGCQHSWHLKWDGHQFGDVCQWCDLFEPLTNPDRLRSLLQETSIKCRDAGLHYQQFKIGSHRHIQGVERYLELRGQVDWIEKKLSLLSIVGNGGKTSSHTLNVEGKELGDRDVAIAGDVSPNQSLDELGDRGEAIAGDVYPNQSLDELGDRGEAIAGDVYPKQSLLPSPSHQGQARLSVRDVLKIAVHWEDEKVRECIAALQGLLEAKSFNAPNESHGDIDFPKNGDKDKEQNGSLEWKMINGHGPYAYLRFREGGRHRSLYLGKNFSTGC